MKLLVITHTFPPSKHSNAKRPQYLVRACLEAGWEVDVATSYIGVEPGQKEVIEHPNLKILRDNDPVERLQGKFRKMKLAGASKLLSSAANGLLFPDCCTPWAKGVFRRFKKDNKEYDRVLAFLIPASMLLSGSAGVVDRRWIFDFQEPITPQFEKYPRKSFVQRALLGKLKRLERDTLHKAGTIVFTAEANRAVYVEKGLAPVERTRHVPYFYDEAAFRSPARIGERFEIGYYGNFDLTGARSPQVFLKSLAEFLDRYPEARAMTRFVFFGNWRSRHDAIMDELGLGDICEINAVVTYDQYLKKLQASPILLLIVAKEHNLFMPSKIVDYFGARRPILAFVPKGSEMSGVLESAGMGQYSCESDDVAQGRDAIGRLWAAHQEGKLIVDEEKTSGWSSAALIPKYFQILEGSPED